MDMTITFHFMPVFTLQTLKDVEACMEMNLNAWGTITVTILASYLIPFQFWIHPKYHGWH